MAKKAEGQSQFSALTQLAVPDLPPAEDLAPDDLPPLPEAATQTTVVTQLVGAQVPRATKNELDTLVVQMRGTYFPDLEMREVIVALVHTLRDERSRRVWLHEIAKLREQR